MTLYTDDVHLMADTPDELHAFARRLDLPRWRFHRDHYDLRAYRNDASHARHLGAVYKCTRELAARRRAARAARKHPKGVTADA